MPEFKKVLDSGNRTKFKTGSQRDTQAGKGMFHLLPFDAITRLAQHFENGARKYELRNWEKGQPTSQYFDSAQRHIIKAFKGMTDEDHLAAALWNIACWLQTEEWIEQGILPKELDDRPIYKKYKIRWRSK